MKNKKISLTNIIILIKKMYMFKIRNHYKILKDFILRFMSQNICRIYNNKKCNVKKKKKKSFFFLNIGKMII